MRQACLRVRGVPVGSTVGQFICERGHDRHHTTDIYCLCPGGWKSARYWLKRFLNVSVKVFLDEIIT